MAKRRKPKVVTDVTVHTKRQKRQAQRLGVKALQSPETLNRRVYDIYKILSNSMTTEEKKKVGLLIRSGSRRKRLMIGSGLPQKEIKGLLDNYGANLKAHLKNQHKLITQGIRKRVSPFDWIDFGHFLDRNAAKEEYESVVKKKRNRERG